MKAWRQANRDHTLKYMKEWAKRNPRNRSLKGKATYKRRKERLSQDKINAILNFDPTKANKIK